MNDQRVLAGLQVKLSRVSGSSSQSQASGSFPPPGTSLDPVILRNEALAMTTVFPSRLDPARFFRMAALAMLTVGLAGAAPPDLDFNRDIRPILAENCFSCHGFDETSRKADLRLDVAEAAYEDRDGIVAVKPGSLDESEVWQRIISDDETLRMPPPRSRKALSAEDRAKIRLWIEQGASYSGLWSFQPPVKPEVPRVSDPPPENPIDAFVRARLEREGLHPAPAADRHTLIRRLFLDLVGLPPSAEEVQAFVQDSDPKAVERLVDRLLDSPHFGERMALNWLDASRYADTNGFSIDGGRHMWLWRDWVIQAFNDNKPYDRFLLEQIAGDLLPNATEADRIATGFQRNNMVTHEGGTIPEENLTNYNADRVKTLGEAVLGLTLGCAQCHNHKFDPITQKDYYQLFSFFNTLSDRGLDGNAGINPAPTLMARTVLRTDEVAPLRAQIAALEDRLSQIDHELLREWEASQRDRLARRGRDLRLHPLDILNVSTPNRGAGFETEQGRFVRLRNAGDLGAFDISAKLPPSREPITGLRVIVHPVPELPGGGWGEGPRDSRGPRARTAANAEKGDKETESLTKGTFVLTAIAATADTIAGDQINLHKLIEIAQVTASCWDPRFPPEDCLDPRNPTGWSPDLKGSGPVHLTVTFREPIRAEETPFLTTQLNFGYGQGMVPGLIELQVLTGEDDGTNLPADLLAILQTPPAERTEEMTRQLWNACVARAEELTPQRVALANLKERLRVLTEPFPTMVMDVAEKPRDTFVLHRGDYSQPTDKVSMGTPAALPPLPADAAPNRLGLARWIISRENPLTARVAVNRFWQVFFGSGIVATPADFGSQGESPTHPDLLDWLAVDFVENGWDVKRLVRQIVTSQTHRGSSATTPDQLDRDPANRLLGRGPRFRLPAELVRDSALKTGGLLVPRIGGPSVNPYTPGDLWREVSHYGSTPATAQTFVQDHGEKLYRRSLYTYWKRTAPPPNMLVFDAPNREVCTVARPSTTTPLQALVLLNDVQFVEASRAFAERVLHHDTDDTVRLRWAVSEALSRPVTDSELRVLRATLERERARYRDREADAIAFLSIGESQRDVHLPATEHAAWSQLAALILNLSEFVTRN
jgi:hypothetical protein